VAGGESAVRDNTINPLLSATGANQSASKFLQDVLCFAGTGTALFQPPMRCLASMDEAELDLVSQIPKPFRRQTHPN